jgi:small GTP-binding protein
MNPRLEKLKTFFREESGFSTIEKPSAILELPFTALKAADPSWKSFFEELDLHTILDIAQFKEPLEIEGLDPNEVNRAAMIAEMVYWQVTQLLEKGDQKKKVIILGLDNAGKTTAVTTLSEKYSSIRQLLPTRGLVRQSVNIFGFEISAFDMGGQADYRNTYFEKKDMYFTATDLIIFCIDIQDSARYDEALQYLKRILDVFREFKLFPPLLVVFTKTDPDIASDMALNKNRINMIDKIETVCDGFDVGYANSSIYDRNSIENIFSLALKRISTSNAVIEDTLKLFLEETESRACALVSSTGLIFGSTGMTIKEEELICNTASYLQNLFIFHIGEGFQREDHYMMEYPRNHMYFIAEFITESESGTVYLWVLTQDLRKEVEIVGKFKDELKPLIDNFM